MFGRRGLISVRERGVYWKRGGGWVLVGGRGGIISMWERGAGRG